MGATLEGVFIAIILMLVIAYLVVDRSDEKRRRIEAEGKLESLEKHLSQAESVEARCIYRAYFALPVDYTGDGQGIIKDWKVQKNFM